MKLPGSKVKAIADWLLELSALVLVFPVLDFVLHGGSAPGWLPWVGVTLAAGLFAYGVYLIPERENP